jgi:hypothetical protein
MITVPVNTSATMSVLASIFVQVAVKRAGGDDMKMLVFWQPGSLERSLESRFTGLALRLWAPPFWECQF